MTSKTYAFVGNRALVLQRMREGEDLAKLRNLFTSEKLWFPLIVSVIEQNQTGKIFVNSNDNPTHAFVVNKFGFCQEVYAEYDTAFFENAIRPYIESRDRMKLRMYYPGKYMQNFLSSLPYASRSTRVHMQYVSQKADNEKISNYSIRDISKNDVVNDDLGLDLANRYYNGVDDFMVKANAVAAYSDDGEIIGIAYSAGEALGVCEKDILVKPQFRGRGVGKDLTRAFINKCALHHKFVSEDIYENNYASISLASAVGAEMVGVYDYYNIEKIQGN